MFDLSRRSTLLLALITLPLAACGGGDDGGSDAPDGGDRTDARTGGPDGGGNSSATGPRLAAGGFHTCAIRSGGSVWCWGYNGFGQLGIGSNLPSNVPLQLPGIENAVAISAGWHNTCAVTAGGQAYCWGINDDCQSGHSSCMEVDPSPLTTPVMVAGLPDALTIVAGVSHSCAVKTDQTVWCWGADDSGQLGIGMIGAVRDAPVRFMGVENVASVDISWLNTCATTEAGATWCSGDNFALQLGPDNEALDASGTALEISGITQSSIVAVGEGHQCVIKESGELWCWGENTEGELGDGTMGTDRAAPARIEGLSNVVSVAAGVDHTCASSAAGVWCWGNNHESMDSPFTGKLGLGTMAERALSPEAVMTLQGAVELSAGDEHTCALLENDDIYCWGLNEDGQLGNGSNDLANAPVQVTFQ